MHTHTHTRTRTCPRSALFPSLSSLTLARGISPSQETYLFSLLPAFLSVSPPHIPSHNDVPLCSPLLPYLSCISRSMVHSAAGVCVRIRTHARVYRVYATVTHRPRIHFVLLAPPAVHVRPRSLYSRSLSFYRGVRARVCGTKGALTPNSCVPDVVGGNDVFGVMYSPRSRCPSSTSPSVRISDNNYFGEARENRASLAEQTFAKLISFLRSRHKYDSYLKGTATS